MMGTAARPTLFPLLFLAVNFAVHEPAVDPATTSQVDPLPSTVAMLFEEQLSFSLTVVLAGAVTVTICSGLDEPTVTGQGLADTPPCDLQLALNPPI